MGATTASGPDKSALRQRLRHRRNDLEPAVRRRAEQSIVASVVSLPEIDVRESAPAGRIAVYLATDGEVDVSAAMEPLRGRRWDGYLPVVGPGRSMTFARWSPGDAMVANRFGIAEPVQRSEQRGVGELDVIIVPCVGIGFDGTRLGYGQGFYDRALAERTPATTVIGVAFDVQVVDGLGAQPWDVPMDVVVTESGVRRPHRD